MKKQINEASVKIDIQGLESNDLEGLSRMLALAGQAEKSTVQSSTIPAMEPLDLDNIGGDSETQPIMDPMNAPSVEDETGTDEPDLDGALDDLSGSITNFGENALDKPVPTGLESSEDFGNDDISNEQDSEYTGDDDFDMDRMSSLAGIHEGLDVDEDDDIPDDSEDENDEELDESLLPDLSLDEDSIASDANKEFGPFNTEFECVADGQEKTNGVEGDNFIVVPKGNKFFWKRTVQEDATNRPEPETFDDSGIIHSKHEYRHKRTALGDNPLLTVTEEEDDYENLDSIFESINAKYKKFMEDNNE